MPLKTGTPVLQGGEDVKLEPRDPPASDSERMAKYRASGRQIACVIRDPVALSELESLAEKHGGVTAAVTAALVEHSRYGGDARVREAASHGTNC